MISYKNTLKMATEFKASLKAMKYDCQLGNQILDRFCVYDEEFFSFDVYCTF